MSLESPFWRFSLTLYQVPDVAPACLMLQDNRGLDVNLLLYALWAGLQGASLVAADFDRLDALIRPWRTSVIQPLRAVRRALKSPVIEIDSRAPGELRARIAAAELDAEQIQQALLFAQPLVMDRASPLPPRAQAIENAARLLAWLAIADQEMDQSTLALLNRSL
jgi:uncharacterized protein (TIGR02444 family)